METTIKLTKALESKVLEAIERLKNCGGDKVTFRHYGKDYVVVRNTYNTYTLCHDDHDPASIYYITVAEIITNGE